MAKKKMTKGQTTIYKTPQRKTRIPLRTRSDFMISGRESGTSGTVHVALDTIPVISHECEKDR